MDIKIERLTASDYDEWLAVMPESGAGDFR